jgi:hypothetical protein
LSEEGPMGSPKNKIPTRHVRILVDRLGRPEAARRLGLSSSTVGAAINSGLSDLTWEIAAEMILGSIPVPEVAVAPQLPETPIIHPAVLVIRTANPDALKALELMRALYDMDVDHLFKES